MSDKKLFIHIPKTGGTAIKNCSNLTAKMSFVTKTNLTQVYLSRLKQATRDCAANGAKTSLNEVHARWIDIVSPIKSKAFCVIRNPWERVASRFFYGKKLITQRNAIFKRSDFSSFEAFLESRHNLEECDFTWHRATDGWHQMVEYIQDRSGLIRCDVLRFSNLDEDINKYFGLKNTHRIPPRNVTVVKNKKATYQSLFTEKTIQIVAELFKDDIETWGFDFDSSSPHRNFWNQH